MVFLIVGRSMSGKKTLLNILSEGGLRISTTVNVLMEKVDAVISSPSEVKTLAANNPDTSFAVVYLKSDTDIRLKRFLKANPFSKNKFIEADGAESSEYDIFEEELERNRMDPRVFDDNIAGTFTCPNNGKKEALYEASFTLLAHFSAHNNLAAILEKMRDKLPSDRNPLEWNGEKVAVWDDGDESPVKLYASIDVFTDMLLGDTNGLARIFTALLQIGFIS